MQSVSRRRFLSFLSASGFCGSIFLYIESFSNTKIKNLGRWELLLFAGLLVVIAMYALEYPHPSANRRIFCWKHFERGIPRWRNFIDYLLVLVVIVHVAWFLLLGGRFGAPVIMDGQYVLDSHGRIVKILTHSEYLSLKEAELRTFATFMIANYFMPTMHWWFPSPQADSTLNVS